MAIHHIFLYDVLLHVWYTVAIWHIIVGMISLIRFLTSSGDQMLPKVNIFLPAYEVIGIRLRLIFDV